MQKLLRLVLLITIVLLNCSTSWCQSNQYDISSTGEFTANKDSVLISFNDLRKVNAKMIELKYEKEINDSLRVIVANDDIIIREYKYNNNALQSKIKQEVKRRKIASWTGLIVSFSLAVGLMIK